MSVEGLVPSAPSTRAGPGVMRFRRASVGLALVLVACESRNAYVVAQKVAPDAGSIAQVRLTPCGSTEYCQSLWVGKTPDSAAQLAALPAASERADEIAWSRDGKRVAFLINGYQLRVYDAQSHTPAGQFNLVPADTTPTTRIARGVTFSDNGAAITFDDCPRDRSGCRPGLLALR